jgi:heme/copper-type cytochrome/quinol oxidase subunit 2
MRAVIVAKTPEEFDQWVKDQQACPAPTDALAAGDGSSDGRASVVID